MGSRSVFKDGGIKVVDSVGNSSFEDIGNPGRYYFVNSPTVRRRGVLEFEHFFSDPTPQSPMFISVNMCSVGNMLGTLKQIGFGVRGLVTLRDKCAYARLAQDVCRSDIIKSLRAKLFIACSLCLLC